MKIIISFAASVSSHGGRDIHLHETAFNQRFTLQLVEHGTRYVLLACRIQYEVIQPFECEFSISMNFRSIGVLRNTSLALSTHPAK